jgi:CDP-diacylglycerol---serine O-phosphatidyltransferase
VFSGKTMRMRVPPELVLPVFVSVIFFIALLVGYPWYILSAGSILFLLSLPMGWKSYRDQAQRAAAPTAPPAEVAGANPAPSYPPVTGSTKPSEDDRPERLH